MDPGADRKSPEAAAPSEVVPTVVPVASPSGGTDGGGSTELVSSTGRRIRRAQSDDVLQRLRAVMPHHLAEAAAGAVAPPSPSAAAPSKRGCTTDELKLSVVLFLTASFFVVELVVGVVTGSLALQADAFHMISDVISIIIGMYAMRSTRRRRDARASYGYLRFEVVGALINGVFLLAVCFTIAIDAISRFAKLGAGGDSESAELLSEANLVLIVGGVGLGINVVGLLVLSHGGGGSGHGHSHGGGGHSHSGHGHNHSDGGAHAHTHGGDAHGHSHDEHHNHGEPARAPAQQRAGCGRSMCRGINLNMYGVLMHVLGDALGSVAVMVAASLMQFTTLPRRELADPVASLAIVIIIVLGTWPLVRQSSAILLQFVPHSMDMDKVKAALLGVVGVLAVHDLHVWQLDSHKSVASLHVIMDGRSADAHSIQDAVKQVLHAAGVHSSAVQMERLSHPVQRQVERILAPAAVDGGGVGLPPPELTSPRSAPPDRALLDAALGEACSEIVCGEECVALSCCPPEAPCTGAEPAAHV